MRSRRTPRPAGLNRRRWRPSAGPSASGTMEDEGGSPFFDSGARGGRRRRRCSIRCPSAVRIGCGCASGLVRHLQDHGRLGGPGAWIGAFMAIRASARSSRAHVRRDDVRPRCAGHGGEHPGEVLRRLHLERSAPHREEPELHAANGGALGGSSSPSMTRPEHETASV